MARYTKDLVLNKPEDFVSFMMNDYAQKNGFAPSDWKGEPALRAGDAMMEGYKFMKWNYDGSVLHVEAWMKGTFGGEWNLDGFVGALQKKPFKESLEQLFELLQQDIPEGQTDMQGAQQPIKVQTVDNTSAATMSLVFGLLSLIGGCFIPLFGIIFAVLGLNRARLGGGSSNSGMATAGKVLSIIGAIISVIGWALNIVLNFV